MRKRRRRRASHRTVACKLQLGMSKPWAFSVVFRMVLQCAVVEMAGIAVVVGCLHHFGTDQMTIAIESDKGFGRHNQTPADRRNPSLKGRHLMR